VSGPPRLADAEFARIAEILRDAFGWDVGPEWRPNLEHKLRRRLADLSLPGFSDYVWLLTYDRRKAEELAHAADLLTTRETYFFREQYQLKAFTDEILPLVAPRAREEKRPVRVWSAGCASGEEAYTLAMLAMESPALLGGTVEVFGTDVSPAALAAARRAEYDASSLRQTTPRMRERWFTAREGRFVVDDRARACVRFGLANLATDPPPPGPFDVAVCRNVAIYFVGAAKRRLARTLHDALVPGGWLLLGHAESLVSVTTEFELVTLTNDLVYRRPGGEQRK